MFHFISVHIGLTWSQGDDSFVLHATPTPHCTNVVDTGVAGAVYHHDCSGSSGGGYDFHGSGGLDDIAADDFDYAVDCGDFLF